MKSRKLLLTISFIAIKFILFAQNYDTTGAPVDFRFKYALGNRYKILSTVNEDVYYNSKLSHNALIINRVTAEITDILPDGSAKHECIYMTTEDSTRTNTGVKFTWGEEYESIFNRSELGVYDISDKYFMPSVRDVPIFPGYAVRPGDSWTAEGHEAHDLRRNFNMQTPYKVPFTAVYKYLGTTNQDGILMDVISVNYNMYMETPDTDYSSLNIYDDIPVMMMGHSNELIYWNRDKGAIDHYTEDFRIVMKTSYGNVFEFKGTAHAEVTDIIKTTTEEIQDSVQQQVEAMGLDNVSVKQSDKGLVISLEDIKFKADSAYLLQSEKYKLQQIAEILQNYPDNDILITGHTALAGSPQSCQKLSEERALSVADYLIEIGVKDQYHIFTQGLGASQPVAPNTTEEGKSKNRRVEITIMDK